MPKQVKKQQTTSVIYVVGDSKTIAKEAKVYKKKADKFEFPKEVELTKSFKDFLESNVDLKYHYNGKPLFNRIKDDINSDLHLSPYNIYVVLSNILVYTILNKEV